MIRRLFLSLALLALVILAALPAAAQGGVLPPPLPQRGLVQRAPFEIPSHLIPQGRAPIVLTVTTTADPAVGQCDPNNGVSLREAIVNCANGSTQPVIYLPSGTYTLASSIVSLSNAFTLIGQDPLTTFIQGSPASTRYFDISLSGANTVTFANVTLRNSTSGLSGNALRIGGNGTVNLDNVRVTGNTGSVRGSVRFDVETSSTLAVTITNSVFSANSASAGGGLAFTNELGSGTGILRISSSVISNNSASTSGGGILIATQSGYTDAVIEDTTVETNTLTSVGLGGGIAHTSNSATSLTVSNSTISNNSAAVGGGIIFNATASTLTIQNSQFLDNGNDVSGSAGALMANAGSRVWISGSLFDGNRAPGSSAGAMWFDTNIGAVVITDTVVSNNTADQVGGIYAFLIDSFTASNLHVIGNIATEDYGGALLAVANFVSLTDSSFTLNSAGTEVGGLSVGRAALLNVRVEDNSAPLRPDISFDAQSGPTTSLGGVSITDTSGASGTFIPHSGDLIDNLLANGGFEGVGISESKPDGWTLTNMSGDKRTCNSLSKTVTPYGRCAMVFKGGAGEVAQISQNADLTGLTFSASEILTLYAMADGSNATSKVKLTLKASYSDQPSNKTSITFTGDHPALTGQSQILTLTSANVTKLKLTILHSSPSGKLTLDRVFLTRAP